MKKGNYLKCIYIHPNTSAKLTLGNSYLIDRISRSHYHPDIYFHDDEGVRRKVSFKTKMFKLVVPALHGISEGQEYEVTLDGGVKVFTVKYVRVTNVDAPDDFIVQVGFENETGFFEENVKRVIGNPDFNLLIK